jgi:branched-chain amino acid transport system permease protein
VRYFIVLTITVGIAMLMANVLRGRIGRSWMMIRDMDIAAELIGIRMLPTKLMAFAISSYFCGVAGAMMIFLSLGSAEPEVFNILLASFPVLFMIIIGGLGSIIGSFLGAAFICDTADHHQHGLPSSVRHMNVQAATVEHLRFMLVGALIIFFLIAEPHGLASLWQMAK